MKKMEIKDMTMEQLKSAAYDALANMDTNKRNLEVLNQAIAAKANEAVKAPEVKPEQK